jgi:hypothetical protein
MAALCASVLFQSLDISRGSYVELKTAEAAESAQKLAELAPIIGHHLRNLTIQIQIPQEDGKATLYDSACATILKQAPHLRFLKLFYAHDDDSSHPILHEALAEVNKLEAVEFWEGDDARPMTEAPIGTPSPRNDILRVLLSYHATSIRSLALRGRILLTDDLYGSLRDNAYKLHTLEIRRALPDDSFTMPVVWSCASCLRHLQLYLCSPHAARTATALMRGCFGLKLETVTLWMNGDTSDETNLRPPANLAWAGAQLEKLDLDHFLPWEMECFLSIPTKLLVATRMEGAHFTKLMRNGAFPGLQTLMVSDRWKPLAPYERDYRNLEEICKARGVELRCTNLSNPHSDDSTMKEPIERICRCWFLRDLSPDYHPDGKGF